MICPPILIPCCCGTNAWDKKPRARFRLSLPHFTTGASQGDIRSVAHRRRRCSRNDANTAPDPEVWLATDESLKRAAIEAHHGALAVDLPNPRLHAAMHAIVENQLAANTPAESRATLERFVAAGVTRHEAVHAIGSVVADALWSVLRRNASVDRDAMIATLAHIFSSKLATCIRDTDTRRSAISFTGRFRAPLRSFFVS